MMPISSVLLRPVVMSRSVTLFQHGVHVRGEREDRGTHRDGERRVSVVRCFGGRIMKVLWRFSVHATVGTCDLSIYSTRW